MSIFPNFPKPDFTEVELVQSLSTTTITELSPSKKGEELKRDLSETVKSRILKSPQEESDEDFRPKTPLVCRVKKRRPDCDETGRKSLASYFSNIK